MSFCHDPHAVHYVHLYYSSFSFKLLNKSMIVIVFHGIVCITRSRNWSPPTTSFPIYLVNSFQYRVSQVRDSHWLDGWFFYIFFIFFIHISYLIGWTDDFFHFFIFLYTSPISLVRRMIFDSRSRVTRGKTCRGASSEAHAWLHSHQ